MAISDFLDRSMTTYVREVSQNPDGTPDITYVEDESDIPCNVQPRGDYGARKRESRGGRMTLISEHYIYTDQLVALGPESVVEVTPGLYGATDRYQVVVGATEDQAGRGRLYRAVVELEITGQ